MKEPKLHKFEFWALPKFSARSKKLTSTDKLVLSAFTTYKNAENEVILKQKTLASFFNVSSKSVERTLAKLIKMKCIEKQRVGKRLSNHYVLLDLEKVNW